MSTQTHKYTTPTNRSLAHRLDKFPRTPLRLWPHNRNKHRVRVSFSSVVSTQFSTHTAQYNAHKQGVRRERTPVRRAPCSVCRNGRLRGDVGVIGFSVNAYCLSFRRFLCALYGGGETPHNNNVQ